MSSQLLDNLQKDLNCDKTTLENVETFPENLKLSKNYKVLVLSGGGSKGVILLGMLHRLVNKKLFSNENEKNKDNERDRISDENNLFINYLSGIEAFIGTSIGSIICLLLLITLTPVEILSYICTKDLSVDTKINILLLISKCGIMSFDSFFDEIQKTTEERLGFIPTMDELYKLFQKDFVCVTHNMTTDETVYIDYKSHPNLSCIEALKMSCNVPLIFEKYMYDKCFYIDGAISDNFPIEYASKRYPDKKILGLYIEKVLPCIREDKDKDIMSYVKVLLTLSFRMNCKKSKKFKADNIDMVMATVNDKYPEWKFDISSSKKFNFFSIGYNVIEKIEREDREREDREREIERIINERERGEREEREREIERIINEREREREREEREREIERLINNRERVVKIDDIKCLIKEKID